MTRLQLLQQLGYGDEDVAWAGKLIKVNRNQKRQERSFLITSNALYNIKQHGPLNSIDLVKPTAVKRRIVLSDISRLTINSVTRDVILHVSSQYDYWLTAPTLDERLSLAAQTGEEYASVEGLVKVSNLIINVIIIIATTAVHRVSVCLPPCMWKTFWEKTVYLRFKFNHAN